MPRPRALSPAAEAEARRFASDPAQTRTHKGGPWGDRPSLRDIGRHLQRKRLVVQMPTAGAIARALWYLYPSERRPNLLGKRTAGGAA
jgi:hypothetical protein